MARPDACRRRAKSGRVTGEEAARRLERVADVATSLFIERGFHHTTMEAIAEAASISKSTLYASYDDKSALFAVALRRGFCSWLVPLAEDLDAHIAQAENQGFEATIDGVSRDILLRTQDPKLIALTKCLAGQSMQFPEIAKMTHEDLWQQLISLMSRLLQIYCEKKEIVARDTCIYAKFFLQLLLGTPSISAFYSIAPSGDIDEAHREAAVAFLIAATKPD